MQLEQEEPERGIKKYWQHFMGPLRVLAVQSILAFPWLSKLVLPYHMGMLMSSEDSLNLVAY